MNILVREIRARFSPPPRPTERGWERQVVFPPEFLGFQGHFPGHPVLPAMVQIMMFRESIAEQRGWTYLEIKKIMRAKFLKVVNPDTPVTLIWTDKETEEGMVYKCILETEGALASSFTLILVSGGEKADA